MTLIEKERLTGALIKSLQERKRLEAAIDLERKLFEFKEMKRKHWELYKKYLESKWTPPFNELVRAAKSPFFTVESLDKARKNRSMCRRCSSKKVRPKEKDLLSPPTTTGSLIPEKFWETLGKKKERWSGVWLWVLPGALSINWRLN